MTQHPEAAAQGAAPQGGWQVIGPGLLVAATGVGAADLVATLVAGSKFGYALLWTVILGALLKVVMVEGAGRYSLATGRTIFEGWRSLGRWTSWYFGSYIVIWGFVYGAAAMSGTGIPLNALVPALSVTAWGIIAGLLGFVLVWFGRYALFERFMAALVGLMFVTMVGAALLTLPNLPALLSGLIPRIPDGGLINVLSLAGGVGGTITLAAYGYWLREKGWHRPQFMRVMRLDNNVAYLVTAIFVISTLIVGAELLYSARIAIEGNEQGLLSLSDILGERYGGWAKYFFLVGFAAASFSSLLGVWNGVSLMFADFVGQGRGLSSGHPDTRVGGKYYRWYVLWLTFPPMALLFLGRPVALILAYGVLGALFMPFLAATLLVLLNSDRVPAEWRNKPGTNLLLGLCVLLFGFLAVTELAKQLGGLLG
ncbi:iron transporter [Deinococcus sp. RL]|uniref:Nramp family divalent metal transporter n=1 Tax=Deinococcus sp. RL TaxID=1489678 RepID=UPI0004D9CE08|nr:Nramp family divalent metal transporter [Deinococcus sp. RL]KEF33532.1 iron transporter [Deinococcus sp. RL]